MTMSTQSAQDLTKRVVPYKSFATDRESWNGPAEVREASTGDLLVMATWYDETAPEVKGSYKLPHHRQSSKRVAWNGLTAAMGALLGARGGVDIPEADRRAVYNHLARHYRNDFDQEPPPFRMTAVRKGRALSALFSRAISVKERAGTSRADLVQRLASGTDLSSSTINQVLSGSINCLFAAQVRVFARVLGISSSSIEAAAERDGCTLHKGSIVKSASKQAARRLKGFMAAFRALFDIAKELGWDEEVAKSRVDAALGPLATQFRMGEDMALVQKCTGLQLQAFISEAGLSDAPALAPKNVHSHGAQGRMHWPMDLNSDDNDVT